MVQKPSFFRQYDVVISGAGFVGLALALAIKRLRPFLSVAVLDSSLQIGSSQEMDGRASALVRPLLNFLQNLGFSEELMHQAQPVRRIVITDSLTQDPVRPVFLRFDPELNKGDPFAYIVPNAFLYKTLLSLVRETDICLQAEAEIQGFRLNACRALVECCSGLTFETSLLVGAEGAFSPSRKMAGIPTLEFEYRQSAIVCTLAHERAHDGEARQHFLPGGPFAMLPLSGNRSSIVWTETNEEAERLIRSDESLFMHELEKRFGSGFGRLQLETPPRIWPVRSMIAHDCVRERFALAGDSAHRVHPLAGQGLNLGLRDVAVLSEILVEADQLGQDIGSLCVLERYRYLRRADATQMIFATDLLNRLFSNRQILLKGIRDFGLGLIERSSFLKRYFMHQALWGVFSDSENAPALLKPTKSRNY